MIQLSVGIAGLVFLFLLALSPVYLRIHPPSTMVMSLTVSGLWTLVCLFAYEFQLYYEEQFSERAEGTASDKVR